MVRGLSEAVPQGLEHADLRALILVHSGIELIRRNRLNFTHTLIVRLVEELQRHLLTVAIGLGKWLGSCRAGAVVRDLVPNVDHECSETHLLWVGLELIAFGRHRFRYCEREFLGGLPMLNQGCLEVSSGGGPWQRRDHKGEHFHMMHTPRSLSTSEAEQTCRHTP